MGSTLLFLLCPYVLSELIQGRPTQALLCFSVLSIHHFLRLHDTGKTRDAVLSGVFAALQGWTYWFGGFFLGFVLVTIVVAHFQRHHIRKYWTALLTCLVFVSPGVILMAVQLMNDGVPGLSNPEQYFWSIPVMDENHPKSFVRGYLLHEPDGMKMFWNVSIAVPLVLAMFFAKRRILWISMLVVSLLIASGPVLEFDGEFIPLYHYIFLYRVLPFFKI